eukprot:PhM_4_TR132/c0_g1_i1/m.57793
MAIDNSVFAVWAEVCIGGSALFLLLQIVVLIDFAYNWNEQWTSKEAAKWGYYLLICSSVMYIFSFVVTGLSYHWFVRSSDGCSLQNAAVTITLLAGIFMTLVSLRVPHGSLLPTGLIFSYSVVQCFTALSSVQDESCNSLFSPTASKGLNMSMVLGALFVGVTLTYTAISTTGSRRAFTVSTERNPDEDDFSEHGFCFLHGVMMLASMYLAMVLTSWGDDRANGRIDNSTASMWVKLATEWATIGVYLWSLIAPYYCCKDRDFGVEA